MSMIHMLLRIFSFYRQLLYVAGNGKTRTFLTKVNGAEVVEILAWTKENYIYYISTLPNQPGSRHVFRVRSPTAPHNIKESYNGYPECLTCPPRDTFGEISTSKGYSVPTRESSHMGYLNRETCNYYSAEFSVSKVINLKFLSCLIHIEYDFNLSALSIYNHIHI